MRVVAASGALLAAVGVALAAYAAHAAAPDPHRRLPLAAAFAFGHGIALAALAPTRVRRCGRFALLAILFGTLLFSGSLSAAQFAGAPVALAPFGGALMIAGWCLYAFDVVRD